MAEPGARLYTKLSRRFATKKPSSVYNHLHTNSLVVKCNDYDPSFINRCYCSWCLFRG